MAERMDHAAAEHSAAAREAQGSGPARQDLNGGGEPSSAPSRDDQTRSAGRDRPREERSHRHSRDRDRDRDRDRGGRDDDRSRSRRDRERSRERSKKSHRSRTRSRDREYGRDDRHRSSRRRSHSREKGQSSRSKEQKSRPRRSRSRGGGGGGGGGSSEEEYGGYVPRRRQDTVPQYPQINYSDPYAALRNRAPAVPQDPKDMARQLQEQQLKARQLVLQQQAASATAAASKTQREVYVGNLAAGLVTEEALRHLFHSTMVAAFPKEIAAGVEPIVNVNMHSEGRYAFVELRTPEMATASLQLNGSVQLLGQAISVGRPSGYVDPEKAQQAAAAAARALEAFQAGDTDSIEMQQTLKEMGINVQQPTASAPAAPGLPPPLPGAPPPGQLAVGGSETPTEYLSVDGMVTAQVLADDQEYKDVIEDLQEECSKHGQVVRVVVPRPPVPSASAQAFGTNNYGKAFAQFSDAASAQRAKQAIHGRLFAGQTIQCSFVLATHFNTLAALAPV